MLTRTKFTALALLSFASLSAVAQSLPVAGSTSKAQTQSQAQGGALDYAPVTTENSTVRYATSSAFAPALTSSNDTCMGSSSLGATGMSFGVALGSTWTDKNCEMLKNARELWNQGDHAAALALLCSDDDIHYAVAVSGGILERREDGTVVHRGCPMTKDQWIAAGRPLIDPSTGQPFTEAQLNPPQKVATLDTFPVSSVDSLGIKTTVIPADSSTSK